MLKIPLMYVKDKQAFAPDRLTLLGNPVDIAKKLQAAGFKLIHIIDADALRGIPSNMDVYDKITYFVNVQVECAPSADIIRKLLGLRCRVVLKQPAEVKLPGEERLMVASVDSSFRNPLPGFHDVLIKNADRDSVLFFKKQKKRVIVFEKDEKSAGAVWGVILASFPSL